MLQSPDFQPALNWLLEEDLGRPSIRYLALRDLTGLAEDDQEIIHAKENIYLSGLIPDILSHQSPEGWWYKPGNGYSPKFKATVWSLILLAELGADIHHPNIQRGCDYILNHGLSLNGVFSAYADLREGGCVPCLNGNMVYALTQLGMGEDERIIHVVDWLAQAVTGENGWVYPEKGICGPVFACHANGGLPCAWGAVKSLKAFLALGEKHKTNLVNHAIDITVNFLLEGNPAAPHFPSRGETSPFWFRLGFPLMYWSDQLELADILTRAGMGSEPSLKIIRDRILDKRNTQGKWKLEHEINAKLWAPVEINGQPSKWITLRALRWLSRI